MDSKVALPLSAVFQWLLGSYLKRTTTTKKFATMLSVLFLCSSSFVASIEVGETATSTIGTTEETFSSSRLRGMNRYLEGKTETTSPEPKLMEEEVRYLSSKCVGTYEDFVIPRDTTADELQVTVQGGDGGKRDASIVPFGIDHYADGGGGAYLSAKFRVGIFRDITIFAIPPGSEIRIIAGCRGDSERSAQMYGAGGGGGSAVLWRPRRIHPTYCSPRIALFDTKPESQIGNPA